MELFLSLRYLSQATLYYLGSTEPVLTKPRRIAYLIGHPLQPSAPTHATSGNVQPLFATLADQLDQKLGYEPRAELVRAVGEAIMASDFLRSRFEIMHGRDDAFVDGDPPTLEARDIRPMTMFSCYNGERLG